jgi:release factor glutamine methyltransferase
VAGSPSRREASPADRSRIVRALAQAGFLAPDAEADEIFRAASEGVGSPDGLLALRTRGEPLAWVTGSVVFCGLRLHVDRGVFVPRPHTEPLAIRAAEVLPRAGTAVDLCTGSGAVAAVVRSGRPDAAVLATDIDPIAVGCARHNGVDALLGDLDDPLPRTSLGRVDVLTAVVPYVPTEELHLLPRDVLTYEPGRALDGGAGGTVLLERAAVAAGRWVAPGGTVLLEIGGDQASAIETALRTAGLSDLRIHRDSDGQDRAIEARRYA